MAIDGDRERAANLLDGLKPCPPDTAANTCSPTTSDEPPVPNFAAWGPDGSLYVSDYLQGVA